jgi:hypothetical protein
MSDWTDMEYSRLQTYRSESTGLDEEELFVDFEENATIVPIDWRKKDGVSYVNAIRD